MSRLYLLLLLICFAGAPAGAQYVGLGKPAIDRLKKRLAAKDTAVERAYAGFRSLADKALEEAPHPIDTIRSEGLLEGNPKKTATHAALADMPKMYALALVYRVSGDDRYLQKVTAFLQAWAVHNTPNGDPIDDTNLDNPIEAYDMVKDKLAFDVDASIRDWLKRTAAIEISSPRNSPQRATSVNNWHSHRLKVLGEIAWAIGDTALQQYTINGLMTQIDRNLKPDGSGIDFESRDALHYHVYDLEPLLKLAILLQRATGKDYYRYTSPQGCSIQRSVTWLLPFVTGEKTHPEFVNSKVPFDRQRAQNGQAEYKAGTLWDPRNGIATVLLASYFDPALLSTVRPLLAAAPDRPRWQLVVNTLLR